MPPVDGFADGLKVGVVADDLTGANDIGSHFAKAGHLTEVYLNTSAFTAREGPPPHVAIIDTSSRLEPPATAYERTFKATLALKEAGYRRFFKKSCSVFRGNVSAEFDAMLDALGEEFAIVVPGYPKNSRYTHGGRMFVGEVPLEDSYFKDDPTHPSRDGDLVAVLKSQTRRRVALVPEATVRSGPDSLRAHQDA